MVSNIDNNRKYPPQMRGNPTTKANSFGGRRVRPIPPPRKDELKRTIQALREVY